MQRGEKGEKEGRKLTQTQETAFIPSDSVDGTENNGSDLISHVKNKLFIYTHVNECKYTTELFN